MAPLRPASVVVSAGRPPRTPGAALTPPVTLSSTFHAAPVSSGPDALAPDLPVDYARGGVDTWEALEAALGELEGGTATVFASGMAAVGAALDALAHPGRHPGLGDDARDGPGTVGEPERPRPLVVADAAGYTGTSVLLDSWAARGWADVVRVDTSDPGEVVLALGATGPDRTALVWLECPTNPLLAVPDLAAAVAAARDAGARVAVDATFLTPLRVRPLAAGADVVVHSVTKSLSGHSDLLMGVASSTDAALVARVRRARLLGGAVPGPMEAWLALRGLRTLDVRLERAERSAGVLAARLAGHPAVQRVRYPGLPGDPGHGLAAAQWDGPGTLLAVEVADAETAEAVASACRVWTHATSLGGVESLVERRRRHGAESALVPQGLLRLSVGIEDVEDLWEDLDGALRSPR